MKAPTEYQTCQKSLIKKKILDNVAIIQQMQNIDSSFIRIFFRGLHIPPHNHVFLTIKISSVIFNV